MVITGMQLKDYLEKNDLKASVWARKNGIAGSVLSRYFHGRSMSPKNARKCEIASNSVVTVLEILFRDPASG
jgi:hypothetical protein